jgi:hypothetical protein
MKEEIKEGMSNLKKGIIGLVGTLVAGVGTFVTTQFNSLLGIEEESEPATEIVVPVENTQQQNVNVTGPEIIINVPQQQAPAPTRTIIRETVKEVPAEPKEEEKVEEKPETPMERMARLKKMREGGGEE